VRRAASKTRHGPLSGQIGPERLRKMFGGRDVSASQM
jgi:ribosomal protein S19E (S16A)